MSYIEYLRDKKRALPQIVSPTRINTSGLFTQMQRYKAAAPIDTPDSAGISIQHKSAANILANIGHGAVCCAPAQETFTKPVFKTITTTYGWPAIIAHKNDFNFSNSVTYFGGSVYITGEFENEVGFYNGGITDISGVSPVISLIGENNQFSAFIAAYTRDGQVKWAAPILNDPDTYIAQGYSIAVNSTGVYAVGIFTTGTIEFYDGTTDVSFNPLPGSGVESLTTQSNAALFIAKYNEGGEVQWVNMVDNVFVAIPTFGSKDGPVAPLFTTGICLNSSGVHICNYYDGPANFFNASDMETPVLTLDPTPGNEPASLLAKYDLNGNIIWVTKIENQANFIYTGNFGFDVECDASRVYMLGTFADTARYYDAITPTSPIFDVSGDITSSTFSSAYVIAYNSDGTFDWVNQCDDTGGLGFSLGLGVRLTVDSVGLYAMILFSNELIVYTNPGSYDASENLTSDLPEHFNFGIVRYEKTTGIVTWINKLTSVGRPEFGGVLFYLFFGSCGLYSDGNNLYVTGCIQDASMNLYNADVIDPTTPAATLNSLAPLSNVFLVKYDMFGDLDWMTIAGNSEGGNLGVGTSVSFDGSRIIITGFLFQELEVVNFYNADGLEQPSQIGLALKMGGLSSYVVEYDTDGQVIQPSTVTSEVGCCYLKLRPYPWNGYAAKRPDPPAINYPPLGAGACTPLLPVPTPPTNVNATGGNRQITITFTPGNDNGSPITDYRYSLNGGPFISGGPTSPITISNLTNGTPYTIVLEAVNGYGPSAATAPVTATPAVLGAPVLTLIIADNSGAYVYFTPGAGTNYASIYSFTTNGGSTFTSVGASQSPVRISPLLNDISQNIQLRATVASASSPWSNTLTVTPKASVNAVGPTLLFDPSNNASYSGSGTTLTSIGSVTVSGTLNGGITWGIDSVAGISSVFNFDGTGYITFDPYDFTTTITATAWIKPSPTSNINSLLTNAGANLNTAGFKLGWNRWTTSDRACYFEGGNGANGGATASVPHVITYGAWQHVGYVYEPLNSRIIHFVNGVPVKTLEINTVSGIPTSGQPFNIGSMIGPSFFMTASLGYLKVYNYLFTATDMLADFQSSRARFGV
jgi:hypothetical protein